MTLKGFKNLSQVKGKSEWKISSTLGLGSTEHGLTLTEQGHVGSGISPICSPQESRSET